MYLRSSIQTSLIDYIYKYPYNSKKYQAIYKFDIPQNIITNT